MDIHFKIDTERMTFDDLITLEEIQENANRAKWRSLKNLLARFVTNEDGEFLTEGDALKVLGQLTIEQINAAASQFYAAINEVGKTAVPPDRQTGSASP